VGGIGIWAASFFGKPYWEYASFVDALLPFISRQLLSPFLMIFGAGIYGLINHKRLHSAYSGGMVWALSINIAVGWLYFNPE